MNGHRFFFCASLLALAAITPACGAGSAAEPDDVGATEEAFAVRPMVYGRAYHIQNGWSAWGGGYLDTYTWGCQGNLLCVSTSSSPTRDGGSGTWVITSADGKLNGAPVVGGDNVYLLNQWSGPIPNGGYLDTDNWHCNGDYLCVSTSSTSNRDHGSGTWKILDANGPPGAQLSETQDIQLQNGWSSFGGGYLDTDQWCAGNLLCVSTSQTINRDGLSTHWRFEPLLTSCPAGHESLDGMSCTVCPAGEISDGTTACAPCAADQYTTDNVTCQACPDGDTDINHTACGACPAGQATQGGATCQACPAGTISTPNMPECTVCPVYLETNGDHCAVCPPGEATQGGLTCTPCAAGSISLPGQTYCEVCGSGTVAANNACSTCPPGKAPQGQLVCVDCPAGLLGLPGNEDCEPCADGFVTTDSATCFDCPPGQATQGALTCSQCPAGLNPDHDHFGGCTTCPIANTAPDGYGDCMPCPAGQATQGALTCSPCPAGTTPEPNGTCLPE